MNLIFIGPQGSGKGTQAKIISQKLQIPHISTGDLLRGSEGELKKEVDSYMQFGKLIPDELMLKILKEKLSSSDCQNGFILDGYPRNMTQAFALDKIIKIDKAIEISIPDSVSIERLSSRLSCSNCGAVFNEILSPPKEEGKCDSCGSRLYQRADDNPEAIKKRLEIYHKETAPILQHYNAVKIDGSLSKERVTEEILSALK